LYNMDRKQVVIVALLIVAVVLSTASVMMNVSVLNNVKISEMPPQPDEANIELIVLPNQYTMGGSSSEI